MVSRLLSVCERRVNRAGLAAGRAVHRPETPPSHAPRTVAPVDDLAVHELAERCNRVAGLPVEFVAWPADERRRAALARAAVPRLLLVAPDADVPAVGVDEDWIRLPATEADAVARAQQLLRVGSQLQHDVPYVDEQRVLHRAGVSVVLTAAEASLLSRLLADAGRVVSHADLADCVWQGAPPSREARDAAIYRLRRRVAGLHLHIASARSRGYVLTL